MSSFFDFLSVEQPPLPPMASPFEAPKVFQATAAEQNGTESGIESASSSSSLDEPGKVSSVQKKDKLVVTATTRLKPQQSLPTASVAMPNVPLEIAVIFRGRIPMINPVPYDSMARLNSMKNDYAKKVQNQPACTFALMHITEEHIKLYSMEEPRKLLQEIECDKLDLIKRSQRDISFFYFSTFTPLKTNVGHSESSLEEIKNNNSRYVCYIFHGVSPKMAERACKLIKHFIDTKAAQNVPQPVSPRFTSFTVTKQDEPKEEKASPTSATAPVDLLFNVDFNEPPSVLDMFDTLVAPAPLQTEPVPERKTNEVDLLTDFFTPSASSVKPQESSFASQHLSYSTQMAALNYVPNAGVNYVSAPAPMPMCTSGNPFVSSCITSTNNMAPSFHAAFQPKAPSAMNPFSGPPMMAPPVPPPVTVSALPPPMKPHANPFIQPPAPLQTHKSTSSIPSYPTMGSKNPFSSSNQNRRLSQTTFDSDFNNFLSQAVKGHLHSQS